MEVKNEPEVCAEQVMHCLLVYDSIFTFLNFY